MNKKRWLLLATLAIVATIVDQIVIHHTNLGDWTYILLGWLIVWAICLLILQKRWLYSIAAVFIISVVEDALFLLWDRTVGRTPWNASFYCHDWVPFSQNWGIPSHYIYSLIIAGLLIFLSKYTVIRLLTFLEILPLKLFLRQWEWLLKKTGRI